MLTIIAEWKKFQRNTNASWNTRVGLFGKKLILLNNLMYFVFIWKLCWLFVRDLTRKWKGWAVEGKLNFKTFNTLGNFSLDLFTTIY